MAKTIRVLKVPLAAFDPTRPPSSLLLSQVRQLQVAVYDAIDSEGEAAACIRALTRLLERLRPQIAPRAHLEQASPRRRRAAKKTTRRRTARKK